MGGGAAVKTYRTIIAGSRTIEQAALVEDAIAASGFRITEVVSGCAPGADTFGEAWAKKRMIPIRRFPADWRKHGNRAGPIRNEEMARYADQLIAVWDGVSHGTADMIERARSHGLTVFVHNYGEARP
jgi:hypothetical protein